MIRFEGIQQKAGYLAATALVISGATYLFLNPHLEARRTFSYGVQAYEDEKFDAAASHFRRSAELSSSPAAIYNLALASWAAAKEAKGSASRDEDQETISQKKTEERTRTAQEAIAEALELTELDDEQILNLSYLDARCLALQDKPDEAKDRLREVLTQKREFKPALRELIRLDTPKGDPTRELLIALAEDDDLEIITEYGSGSSASQPSENETTQ